jgi:hypothetical protein
MKTALLYTLATVQALNIVCFTHITKRVAVDGGDLEKSP